MQLHIIKTVAGRATFAENAHRPNTDPFEAYEVAAVPGAAEARAAWIAHNEAAKPIAARIKPSAEIVMKARQDHKGGRIAQADLDAVELKHQEIYKDLEVHAREGKRLARVYDKTIVDAVERGLSPQALAAQYVLDRAQKLAEAVATLEELIAPVRVAYERAGKPGRDPFSRNGSVNGRADGGAAESIRCLQAITTYDLDSLAAAASGGDYMTHAQMIAAKNADTDAENRKAAAAVRRRRA